MLAVIKLPSFKVLHLVYERWLAFAKQLLNLEEMTDPKSAASYYQHLSCSSLGNVKSFNATEQAG